MVNIDRVDKVLNDHESITTYRRVAAPRKDTYVPPAYPLRNVPLNPNERAAEFGIEQPLLRYYLEVAFQSDNPLIVAKLKELLMCVKLTLDTEDKTLEVLNRDIRQYHQALELYKNQVDAAERKFEADTKHYELHIAKKSQDLSFYVDDLVEGAIKRKNDGEATVWDNLTITLLEEYEEFKHGCGPLEDMFEEFKQYTAARKHSFIEELKTTHREWIELRLQELEDEYYDKHELETQQLELEAEEFLDLFEENGDPKTDYAWEVYDERVAEINSQLRAEAHGEAVRQLQSRYYNGDDGYDTIYHYGPLNEKPVARNYAT